MTSSVIRGAASFGACIRIATVHALRWMSGCGRLDAVPADLEGSESRTKKMREREP
jgi:hypothetical protein